MWSPQLTSSLNTESCVSTRGDHLRRAELRCQLAEDKAKQLERLLGTATSAHAQPSTSPSQPLLESSRIEPQLTAAHNPSVDNNGHEYDSDFSSPSALSASDTDSLNEQQISELQQEEPAVVLSNQQLLEAETPRMSHVHTSEILEGVASEADSDEEVWSPAFAAGGNGVYDDDGDDDDDNNEDDDNADLEVWRGLVLAHSNRLSGLIGCACVL